MVLLHTIQVLVRITVGAPFVRVTGLLRTNGGYLHNKKGRDNMFFTLFIIIGLIAVLEGFCFRNNWVYDKRTACIDNDFDKYKRLPSYEHMLYRFWIWDIDKFLGER
jgi:hypothetical protein